ncbi:F-box/LRR-repeat protein At5g02910-like [Rhododendron vialii]|uniref:F-box/LRR-repeat protein At5g02910-like n=1 Tax=Rhododendron vialii TaxID=182163 RepID=UPI00265F4ACE|nr:F-box/LRR-repeat protein At5g02910-like [Rhododendron vialii]
MLELYRYDGFSRLNINNASLKKLILRKFVGRTYEEDEAYGEDDPAVDEADGEDNPQVDEANGEDDPQVDEADGPEVDEADGEDDPEVADWQHGPEEDEADGEHDRVGLVISAPYLQTLEISGRAPRNCRLLDLSSLVYAKLACKLISDGGDVEDVEDFERIQAEFRGLLSSFVHLKSLAVGEWALQVLPIMEAKGLTSPLLNCTSLTLETCLTNDVFPGVASMLGISPNLETLVITKFFPSGGTQYYWIQQAKLCNFKEEHYWTSQKRIFKCLSRHLKNVVFADSSWLQMYGCESNFFDLVQFLLKNAKVLQKIIINTSRLEDVMPKEFFQASKKILSFPRSSPEAVVLFS